MTFSLRLFIAKSHPYFSSDNFLFMSLVEIAKCNKAEKGTPRFKGNRGGIGRSEQNATSERPASEHNESPSYCFWDPCLRCNVSRLLGPNGTCKLPSSQHYTIPNVFLVIFLSYIFHGFISQDVLSFLENRKENRSWYKGSRIAVSVSWRAQFFCFWLLFMTYYQNKSSLVLVALGVTSRGHVIF